MSVLIVCPYAVSDSTRGCQLRFGGFYGKAMVRHRRPSPWANTEASRITVAECSACQTYKDGLDDAVWNHAVFSKNRDRLLNQDLAQKFFAHVKEQAAGLMSDEHFTVDGTLIEAWAGQQSFRRKDNDGSGERRKFPRRVTPQPDARLAHRPGSAAL